MRWSEAAVVRASHVALGLALALAGVLAAQEWRGPEELEVRVEDAKGRPLAGAEVVLDYASRELGGPAPLLTDAKGRIAIGGLAPGRWALEVRKPGFMSFRAEIALAGGEKPELVIASQHNVPGAVSTLRVRLGRARNAPQAPARVELAAAFAPPPVAAPAPAAPPPIAPAKPAAIAAPPAAARAPIAPTTAPAPAPVAVPDAVPVAPAPAVVAPSVAAPSVAPPPVAAPPALPPAAAPPVAAAVPPARLFAAAPMARACYECRPGESALLAEAELAAGGASCPAGLAARLAELPLGELSALAAALPGGCALLAVELPATARYAGFRYEAAGGNGRSEDCLAGHPCPAGACRFAGEPVVRREGAKTVVLALFESTAARRAGFTVYWRRTR